MAGRIRFLDSGGWMAMYEPNEYVRDGSCELKELKVLANQRDRMCSQKKLIELGPVFKKKNFKMRLAKTDR